MCQARTNDPEDCPASNFKLVVTEPEPEGTPQKTQKPNFETRMTGIETPTPSVHGSDTTTCKFSYLTFR